VPHRLRLPLRLAEAEVAEVAPLEEDAERGLVAAQPLEPRALAVAARLRRAPEQARAVAVRRSLAGAQVVAADAVDRAASGSVRILIRAT